MNQHRSRPPGTVAGGLAAAMLLVLAGGCTSDEGAEGAPSPLPSRSVRSGATLAAKPVSTELTIAKVLGGRLDKERRVTLRQQVSRVVSDYFDDAFLAGEYPRRDFSDAFGTFSRGAADRARKDRVLLTNADIGTSTESVVPRAKKVRLYTLVHNKAIAGLTARIRLVFVQESADGADQRVTVTGRLLMNRKEAGPWQIFGYDLTRSSVPTAKGASR